MDSGETPFDFPMNREAQVLLEEALAEINPVFRAALVLREVEDMSYEEIADILEVSIGTVKSRIVRGREALRRNLATRLDPAPSVQLVPRTAWMMEEIELRVRSKHAVGFRGGHIGRERSADGGDASRRVPGVRSSSRRSAVAALWVEELARKDCFSAASHTVARNRVS